LLDPLAVCCLKISQIVKPHNAGPFRSMTAYRLGGS